MENNVHAVIDWLGDADWVFPPAQTRSKDSLKKVLLSAKTLFVENGYSETTVADISRHSGVSVGSIYHRFKDKQSILYAMLDSYTRTRFAQVDSLTKPEDWQGKTAAEVLDFHIEMVFSSARRDTGMFRMLERQRMVDPRIRDWQIHSDTYICGVMTRLYSLVADQIQVADLATAVRYVHLVTRGAVMWAVSSMSGVDNPLDIFSEEFRQECFCMAQKYLGIQD